MLAGKSTAAILALVATPALLAPAPVVAQAAPTLVANGRCDYGERVVRNRGGTGLILCDSVSISRDGASAVVAFARNGGGVTRFAGAMAGDRMTVSQLTFPGGDPVAASGTCEILHRGDGTLSTVSCLARASVRSVAANFVPSRL